MIICRWSVWNPSSESILLLNHSVASFQHFFGNEARYVIFTDDVPAIQKGLKISTEIYSYTSFDHPEYLEPAITWRKWAPRCRYDWDAVELRIDADMFLLLDPVEIKDFCKSGKARYLITLENFKELWPYGNFAQLLKPDFTPINAGLVGQQVGADISDLLAEAYEWWKKNVHQEDVKYHDEQGAVSYIFQSLIKRGDVMLLPPEKYQIVCPLNKPPVSSVDGIILLHATYPEHPAFHQFLDQIIQVSGIKQ